MAPPTLVHNRKEVFRQYDKILQNPNLHDCELRSISQHECTFKVSEDSPPEIICLPFKRIFQRCIETAIEKDKITGKKTKVDKWVNIEVTSAETNQDLLTEERYRDDVRDFVNAEKELKKLMEKGLTD